jgi:hypothetical protein
VWLLAHVLGLDEPTGRWYLWWSGPGSDLGELAIVAVVYHHLNCHEPRCWRIARHRMDGRCRKHAKRPLEAVR